MLLVDWLPSRRPPVVPPVVPPGAAPKVPGTPPVRPGKPPGAPRNPALPPGPLPVLGPAVGIEPVCGVAAVETEYAVGPTSPARSATTATRGAIRRGRRAMPA